MINCNSCGFTNPNENSFCGKCGNKLSKTKHHSNKDVDKKPQGVLSNKLMFYVVFVLILAGILILSSSGIFDDPAGVSTNQNSQNNSQSIEEIHGGADLAVLEEINGLEKLVTDNPKDFASLLKLAHLLTDNGFYQRAIVKYSEYLVEYPDVPDVIVDLGVTFFNLKDYNSAISHMEKAINIEPKHQKAHFNMGIIYFVTNNHDEAIKWWQKAVDIDPTSDVGKKAASFIKQH